MGYRPYGTLYGPHQASSHVPRRLDAESSVLLEGLQHSSWEVRYTHVQEVAAHQRLDGRAEEAW